MLKIEGLTTGYGSRVLLRNVDASLERGELVALIGANGVGKSTLLKVLRGELSPLEGLVDIDGRNIAGMSRMDLARNVSVVNTDRLEVGALSVEDVVGMGRYPYTGFLGRLGREDRAVVAEAMEAVGVEGFACRNVAELSDGERQRVLIARALAQDTPVVLLDEPTAFLDVASRVEVLSLLRKLAKERRKGVLLSLHDVASALALSDRLWLMPGDCSLRCGAPGDFLREHEEKRPGNALDALFAGRKVRFDGHRMDYVGL